MAPRINPKTNEERTFPDERAETVTLANRSSQAVHSQCLGVVLQARRSVTARIIDGKAVARQVEEEVAAELRRIGYQPGLTAVRVGNDPASEIYVRNKAKKA